MKLESVFIASQNMVQQTIGKLTLFYYHIAQLKNVSLPCFSYIFQHSTGTLIPYKYL